MKIKLLLILTLLGFGLQAQITNEGEPKSWSLESTKSITPVVMPTFNLERVQEEDLINDADLSKPWRFGYEYKVDFGINNSGVWDELPNGDRIWRLNVVSTGAKTMNFVFDMYQVPTGATVYLYNNDRSDLLGAYTNVFNNEDEMLGTWMVQGDNIWIEYHEPARVKGQGKLNLSRVVHGYRSVSDAEVQAKALNSSGSCNLDVDCSVGSDFDPLKERLKHSVAFIIMQGFVCTGTLINNTNNDRTPYFLTANHCNAGPESTWSFRFNWISPNPSCATTTGSTDATINQTTSGATRLAVNSNTDVRLLRLNTAIDNSWDIEWAGWDRTDDFPSYVVGIHHPSADIMKVCRDDSGVTKETNTISGSSAETWEITSAGSGWELGVTEGGSSGSALFNPNGQIIGQLYGGAASCSGTNDNNALDFYGRFALSWNENNFQTWLDPAGTGQTTLDMLSQTLSVQDRELENSTVIYPNPSNGIFNISNTTGNKLTYAIYNILGQNVSRGEVTLRDVQIDISSNRNGMYFITVEDTVTGGIITEKMIFN